ncbi:MAG: GAF domain-containing protein, partial [Gemmatimonadota bacterium]|nr:GAF domain-containing protein [Gemmatimonadota bacterium]
MTARVLIADEDGAFLADAAPQIGLRGYELSWAANPPDLPRRALADIPEMLLLDARLAVASDRALLKELRAAEAWRDTAIIVVAPEAPDGSLAQLLELGVADVATRRDVDEILVRLDTQESARRELLRTREALRGAATALKRARDEAESRRKLVDILHEVAGDFSPEELFHVLVRRVALALSISHCSLILARDGDDSGVVATAFENPALNNLEISLDRYPEIRAALATNEPVLIEDVGHSALYATVRQEWAASGFTVPIHSVIALPFTLDARRSGVFFLRTLRGEAPLTRSDVEFAESVVRAAVGALRRSQAIESTRADRE